MHFTRPLESIVLLGCLCALIGVSGCAVRAYPPTVGGYVTVSADSVPADIYSYPHVAYEGGYAYLVGDRWYYSSEGGWVVLRSEPTELYRYRTTYVQTAPAAPVYRGYERRDERRQYAPPAPYSYPPPAVRVQ